MNNPRQETLNRDCIFRERQNLRGNVSRNKPQQRNRKVSAVPASIPRLEHQDRPQSM
jgi:hypothetical protein